MAATTLSDAEWRVMNCVWDQAPVTARQVLDEVSTATGWAYTTVKTLLARLVEKGVLKATMRDHTSVYTPRLTRRRARRAAARDLLDKAFDGALGPLVHSLLEEQRLSAKERAELRRMLEELEG